MKKSKREMVKYCALLVFAAVLNFTVVTHGGETVKAKNNVEVSKTKTIKSQDKLALNK